MSGELTVITGPMFADKTNTLIDLIENQPNSLVLKPKMDNRYEGHEASIISHSGRSVYADAVENLTDYEHIYSPEEVTCVFIDEGHFFPHLVEEVQKFISRGVNVTVAGLDLTYNIDPFPSMQTLVNMAKRHIQLRAYCECGDLAPYTMIKKEFNTGSNIIVGGKEKYQPACARCHTN